MLHNTMKKNTMKKTEIINFGNITGSGYPVEYVRANPDKFPLSGLPESKPYRDAFLGTQEYSWSVGGTGGKSISDVVTVSKKL
jgi:hypothetical protein